MSRWRPGRAVLNHPRDGAAERQLAKYLAGAAFAQPLSWISSPALFPGDCRNSQSSRAMLAAQRRISSRLAGPPGPPDRHHRRLQVQDLGGQKDLSLIAGRRPMRRADVDQDHGRGEAQRVRRTLIVASVAHLSPPVVCHFPWSSPEATAYLPQSPCRSPFARASLVSAAPSAAVPVPTSARTSTPNHNRPATLSPSPGCSWIACIYTMTRRGCWEFVLFFERARSSESFGTASVAGGHRHPVSPQGGVPQLRNPHLRFRLQDPAERAALIEPVGPPGVPLPLPLPPLPPPAGRSVKTASAIALCAFFYSLSCTGRAGLAGPFGPWSSLEPHKFP